MSKARRIWHVALSLLMIACALILPVQPQGGLLVVAIVLAIMLLMFGVGKLVYYIRMARHTAGGLSVLFTAIISLDVGIFAISVIDSPEVAIAIYLIAYNAVTGFLTIARGLGSKMNKAPWVADVVKGLVFLVIGAACIACFKSGEALLWIFCLVLLYDAGVHLMSTLKPTEVVYIQ